MLSMPSDNEREIELKVCDILSSTFGIERGLISSTTDAGDIPGWDSLGHMSLVTNLETQFDVRFPVYALSRLTSVDAIVRELMGLLA